MALAVEAICPAKEVGSGGPVCLLVIWAFIGFEFFVVLLTFLFRGHQNSVFEVLPELLKRHISSLGQVTSPNVSVFVSLDLTSSIARSACYWMYRCVATRFIQSSPRHWWHPPKHRASCCPTQAWDTGQTRRKAFTSWTSGSGMRNK